MWSATSRSPARLSNAAASVYTWLPLEVRCETVWAVAHSSRQHVGVAPETGYACPEASAAVQLLTDAGYKVHAASKGSLALGAVERSQPDLILLDIKMPGISGLKLKKELSLLDPALKFIFVTGHGGKQDGDPEQQEIYLSKPLDIDLLIKVIDRISNQ